MNSRTAYNTFDSIYCVFGRQAPREASGQFQTLLTNIAEIPDECASYIYQRATDLDSLPQNLTKFFRTCFEAWKSDNPGKLYRESCQTCGGSGGWTYFRQIEDGSMHEFFSPCPSCTWIPHNLREKVRPACQTPPQLKQRGCWPVSPSYKGGLLKYRIDANLDAKPEHIGLPTSGEEAKKAWMNRVHAINQGRSPLQREELSEEAF